MAVGEREGVHHRGALDGDRFGPADLAEGVDGEVGEVRPGVVVGDGVQFSGERVADRVRGEAGREGAVEVDPGQGFESGADLERERAAVPEGEGASGVPDQARVGGVAQSAAGTGGGEFAERPGDPVAAQQAVAVPLGAAAAQAQAVHHGVAGEGVVERGVVGADRVGADPQQGAVELDRELAADGQVGVGDLLGDRAVSAAQEVRGGVGVVGGHRGSPLHIDVI